MVGHISGIAQNPVQKDSLLKRLHETIDRTTSDSLRIRLSLKIAYEHFNNGSFDQSTEWYEKAINEAIDKKRDDLRAIAIFYYAVYYINKREPDGINLALRFIENQGGNLSDLEFGVLNYCNGQQKILKGKLYEGEILIKKAQKLFASAACDELSLKVNFALGNIMLDYGRSKAALDYFLKSIALVKESDNRGLLFYNIGSVYYDLKKYKKALEYLKKAAQVFEVNKSGYFSLVAKIAEAETLTSLNRRKEAIGLVTQIEKSILNDPISPINVKLLEIRGTMLRAENKLPQSTSMFKEALAIADTLLKDQQLKLEFLSQLSENYFLSENYKLSKNYIDSIKLLASDQGRLLVLSDAHLREFRIDSTLGNHQDAILNLKNYFTVTDSLAKLNNDEKISRLEKEFEGQQKDQEIAKLKLENKNQELTVARNRNSLSFILLMLLGALAFIMILYYRNSSKTKVNNMLREKEAILNNALQEKELLLKEIHHRVKNNLQLIMSLLAIQGLSQEKENKVIKAFLEKGESRIRSMALIHQILYETEGVQHVNFKHSTYRN